MTSPARSCGASRPLPASEVLRCDAVARGAIESLLLRFGLAAVPVADDEPIPGSYWGAPEAGLVGRCLYFRQDTPVHSLLHEFAHFICMDPPRRAGLDTDAGGDDDEECAVCCLQVLLAPALPPFDADRCLTDMDAWGYSFREGSARAWFAGDGRAARAWLVGHGLIDESERPTGRLRQSLVGFGASP